jgi:hypothetical protein
VILRMKGPSCGAPNVEATGKGNVLLANVKQRTGAGHIPVERQ